MYTTDNVLALTEAKLAMALRMIRVGRETRNNALLAAGNERLVEVNAAMREALEDRAARMAA